ncbi:MAG: hypothetical protein LKI80_04855 [Sporolactobacillus sp.]|nr:hypothetical protein [Sporolactobacillus sp.]
MTNIEINELISVLEKIRAKQHPEIPASLIREIVDGEFSSQDDRTKARHDTQKVIDAFLKTIAV